MENGFSTEDVSRWLDAQTDVNAQQKEFLETVAAQVLRDNTQPDITKASRDAAPMRWLLHGKPGTGKSHANKELRDFFHDVVGYKQDAHFQIVALQATMAAQISGDTIHHALHIRQGEHYGAGGKAGLPSDNKLAKRM